MRRRAETHCAHPCRSLKSNRRCSPGILHPNKDSEVLYRFAKSAKTYRVLQSEIKVKIFSLLVNLPSIMIPYPKLLLLFWMFRFIRQNRYIPILIVVVLAFILRIYSISKLPPGLYDDEVAIGYNAYSILTKGTDEYGTPFPLTFRSFDDYKLPGYIYLDTIPIALFGKNAFAVRLPSVISGTLTVLFLYLFLENLLSLEFEPSKKKFRNLPLLSAFILAILPWHIQFSRAAYESVLALCFFMIGCWQSIVFYKNKRILYLLTSLFFFTLASYTYHSFRILTPIAFLSIFYFLFIKKYIKVKNLFLVALYCLILNLPSTSVHPSQRSQLF